MMSATQPVDVGTEVFMVAAAASLAGALRGLVDAVAKNRFTTMYANVSDQVFALFANERCVPTLGRWMTRYWGLSALAALSFTALAVKRRQIQTNAPSTSDQNFDDYIKKLIGQEAYTEVKEIFPFIGRVFSYDSSVSFPSTLMLYVDAGIFNDPVEVVAAKIQALHPEGLIYGGWTAYACWGQLKSLLNCRKIDFTFVRELGRFLLDMQVLFKWFVSHGLAVPPALLHSFRYAGFLIHLVVGLKLWGTYYNLVAEKKTPQDSLQVLSQTLRDAGGYKDIKDWILLSKQIIAGLTLLSMVGLVVLMPALYLRQGSFRLQNQLWGYFLYAGNFWLMFAPFIVDLVGNQIVLIREENSSSASTLS